MSNRFQNWKLCLHIISIAVVSFLLAGCAPGLSFSAEEAAVNAAVSSWSNRGVVDPNSVTVHQMQEIADSRIFLISFSQVADNRQEECVVVYCIERRLGLWAPASGGGGCSGVVLGQDAPPPQAVDLGGGSSGGSPREPGYSHANGRVHQEDIAQIRVTWEDGVTQEVGVINGSFLALRSGIHTMNRVEGLNTQGEVVYEHRREVDPGKIP